ncbi:unnamed protein product [Pedinophyceae sp. YPF-701]|nr:unnamed protein product [Pedinophyceae sp. YPF-701]
MSLSRVSLREQASDWIVMEGRYRLEGERPQVGRQKLSHQMPAAGALPARNSLQLPGAILIAVASTLHMYNSAQAAEPAVASVSFSPATITALAGCPEVPGVDVFVGLSTGEVAILDASTLSTKAEIPKDVVVLCKPDEITIGSDVVAASILPGASDATAVVVYACGTAATFVIPEVDPESRLTKKERKAINSGIGFSVTGMATRVTAATVTAPPMLTGAVNGRPGREELSVQDSLDASGSTATNSHGGNGQNGAAANGLVSEQRLSAGAHVTCAALSPDGRMIAMGFESGTTAVLDRDTLALQQGFTSFFGSVLCLAWSPDAAVLAAGGQDDLIAVYSLRHRATLAWCEAHQSWVSGVAFDGQHCQRGSRDPTSDEVTPDVYRVVSVGQDCQLAVWDVVLDADIVEAAEERRDAALALANRAASISADGGGSEVGTPGGQAPGGLSMALGGMSVGGGAKGEGVVLPSVPRGGMTLLMPLVVCAVHPEPCCAVLPCEEYIFTVDWAGAVRAWRRPRPTVAQLAISRSHARKQSQTKVHKESLG